MIIAHPLVLETVADMPMVISALIITGIPRTRAVIVMEILEMAEEIPAMEATVVERLINL